LIVGIGLVVGITLVGNLFAPQSTTATGNGATALASRAAGAVAPAAVAPAAGASAAAASAPANVSAVRVAHTDGVGAFVRRTPNLNDRLRAWPDNTLLRIVGPDTTAEGVEWRQVEDPAGNRGWIPSQYTRPDGSS
jgi:hypothetical protein